LGEKNHLGAMCTGNVTHSCKIQNVIYVYA
jgi:hypothetical protein